MADGAGVKGVEESGGEERDLFNGIPSQDGPFLQNERDEGLDGSEGDWDDLKLTRDERWSDAVPPVHRIRRGMGGS